MKNKKVLIFYRFLISDLAKEGALFALSCANFLIRCTTSTYRRVESRFAA